MKPNTGDAVKEVDRQPVNGRTLKAYTELAGKCSNKEILTKEQKDHIKESWKKDTGKEHNRKTRSKREMKR